MIQSNQVRSFTILFLVIGMISGIVGTFLLFVFGQLQQITALLTSWLLSLVVVLSGYTANHWAFTKSHKIFLSVLFGGMVVRIGIVVGIGFLIYIKQWMPMLWFLIFLVVYYFLFQIVEVIVINRQLKTGNKLDGKS